MRIPKYKNEPYTDFSKKANRERQVRAIEVVESKFNTEYDIVIGGDGVRTATKFNSYNPSDPDQVVGVFQKGSQEEADRAIEVATEKFEEWKRVSPKKRAEYLFKLANVMRKRRFELNAAEILEVGKPWTEADADVAESIDFCEFYAREMLRLEGGQPLVRTPKERNELWYIPLGPGVVIPPWNFPLALLTGMTTASIVAGNTVVVKPSSDSALVGYKLMEMFDEVGLPPGVMNFVTGPGGAAGETLVNHPKTRFVSFTGSKEVGVRIYDLASKVQPGQVWLKRVVAEMGGKDSIIVDHDTNLDEAAAGVTVSAFGFQGQKCSACSRAIVVEKIYDRFLHLLTKRAESITVGPAKELSNFMGPVINKGAEEKICQYIHIGEKEGGRIVAGGGKAPGKGYFLRPTVIADVDPRATIAQEEIFGPVLAVVKARDFNHALDIANNTIFGLTGAVYSRNRRKVERAKRSFHVGNLYINRKCTGALVGVHPFGGFNMSGTDSKAGGRDYLLLYTQAKSISEKVKGA
ncbi:MAG TPA: L-glutamate gamma-semialdehyde dehydrogenase [Bacteroidota bacterium]